MKRPSPLYKLYILLSLACLLCAAWQAHGSTLTPPPPQQVQWRGLLGDAIDKSHAKRLRTFIVDEHSEAIALFSREKAEQNTTGRYWGEHAGKWLFAASRAAARSGDGELAARVRRVADYIIGTQEADGYIGTYPREWRFMRRQQEMKSGRWDVWVTAYTMMGLLEANRHFPDARYVNATRRMADLCCDTFIDGKINIINLSNHSGLSSVILLEPLASLYIITKEPRYLELAKLIIKCADEQPGFELTKKCLGGGDVQTIATGKAYQLCWLLHGIARLHQATGDAAYLQMARNAAESIRRDHLTLGGGPWGGIASHREVFNPKDFFSPCGLVETCSIMAWIQLNRILLEITGAPGYAEEIERAAYNALLGAQDGNGEDWCYYTFPNGRRVNTSHWKCCKSSGAMALEELAPAAYALSEGNDIFVNIYGENQATLSAGAAGDVHLEQRTSYPADGNIEIRIRLKKAAQFTLALRVPSWAATASFSINGKSLQPQTTPSGYARITRKWADGDVVNINFPMRPVLHRRSNMSQQDTNEIRDGRKVMQTVMRYDYIGITRGPLVYATDLIDGYKQQETLRLPSADATLLEEITPESPGAEPSIRLNPAGRPPLVFTPYYRTGGRSDGAWRLTWMQVTE